MNTHLKYILIGLVLSIMVIIAIVINRMFFQFNQKEISIYVNEEAAKYANPKAAAAIITDGVEYILSSHNLSQQVIKISRATGSDLEQELVHAAVNQCISFKYLKA